MTATVVSNNEIDVWISAHDPVWNQFLFFIRIVWTLQNFQTPNRIFNKYCALWNMKHLNSFPIGILFYLVVYLAVFDSFPSSQLIWSPNRWQSEVDKVKHLRYNILSVSLKTLSNRKKTEFNTEMYRDFYVVCAKTIFVASPPPPKKNYNKTKQKL